ncbi:MAG: TMEM175 family protein [Caldilineaceae bacterium]
MERIVFFSDAVIAIAITLLAIEIRLPPLEDRKRLVPALWALWPSYLSFAISFLVIGTYWISASTTCSSTSTATRPR